MKRLIGVGLVCGIVVCGILATPAVAAPSPGQLEAQFGLASQRAVKVLVETEGWHRVRFVDLKKAGFAVPAKTTPLQLYVEGKQVAVRVTSTAVEFYGVPLDTLSTKRQTYWLVKGSKAGLRLRTGSGGEASGPFAKNVAATSRVEPALGYVAGILNGEASNLFGTAIRSGEETRQKILPVHLDPTGAARLIVVIQGFSRLPHSVRVRVNGSEVGTAAFEGAIRSVNSFPVASGVLKEGENVVSFQSLRGELDISLVDSVQLTYARRLAADGDILDFVLPAGQRARVGGFSRRDVRVVDVTTPARPLGLRTAGSRSADGFRTTIGSAKRTRHLVAFVDGNGLRPSSVIGNRPSSLHAGGQGAALVIVTHRRFLNALQPLVAMRQRLGLKVAVSDVEDVYDEFGFGAHGPEAIKDFLAWTRTHWTPAPRYVLLVGDASNDPRNDIGTGDFDFVPTKYVDTVYLETPSDDALVDVDGDGVPELAVGRLPVRTVEQATAVVSKLVRYEAQATAQKMLLVSDKQIDYDFEASSRTLYGLIPSTWTIQEVKRAQGPTDAAVRARLLDALNQGPSVVNFFGHGSIGIWTSGPILGAKDAALLRNSRLSLYVMMTCLNGYFTDPEFTSLGEALLYNPSGGAAAVWSSTGETVPTDQILMDQKALGLLLANPETTLGDAMVQAKAAIRDPDVRRTWVLFGDPTMRLR